MARRDVEYCCTGCGTTTTRWEGRCGTCGEWATIEEAPACRSAPAGGVATGSWTAGAAAPLTSIADASDSGFPIGMAEVDRVLGGGLVPGSVTLLGGEPGVGKSTLLLQAAASLALSGRRVLYVSAEEAPGQIRRRANRLRMALDGVWLLSETRLERIVAEVATVSPQVVILDSIQTVAHPELGGIPGTPNQVRDCALGMIQVAKQEAIAVVLVGHVTKEGTLAGPRMLEHLVDTVLTFDSDRHQYIRVLRAVKHRFGGTNEVGLLEMSETGLVAVADPSGVFLADRQTEVAGSAVVPVVEGHRPLLVEVQALVGKVENLSPLRSAEGIDRGRLTMVLAVLDRRAELPLARHDVHSLAAGGAQALEPGVDLGLALAIASSVTERVIPPDMVACGELGLAGEVRQVAQVDRRLQEAARVGFRRALVPAGVVSATAELELHPVRTIAEAIARTLGPG